MAHIQLWGTPFQTTTTPRVHSRERRSTRANGVERRRSCGGVTSHRSATPYVWDGASRWRRQAELTRRGWDSIECKAITLTTNIIRTAPRPRHLQQAIEWVVPLPPIPPPPLSSCAGLVSPPPRHSHDNHHPKRSMWAGRRRGCYYYWEWLTLLALGRGWSWEDDSESKKR